MARRVGLKQRNKVIDRDGKTCYLCGIPVIIYPDNEGRQPPNTLTMDHVKPLASWGLAQLEGDALAAAIAEANDLDNLGVSCALCNVSKDDLMPADDYMERQLWNLHHSLRLGVPLRPPGFVRRRVD